MLSSDAPIGVFDSGVGGLTVLKALTAELPGERFIYLGDTARLPYGTKSAATVARYSVQAAEALAKHHVKCLVIACNTASAVGLPEIRKHVADLPVVGVVEPGADAACMASPTGNIAVIATEGTVRGGAYQQAIKRRRPESRVAAVATPLFVALAEEGLCDGPIVEAVVRHYLEPLFGLASAATPGAAATVPDTLVLGCTHFPMLADSIRAVVGERVRIVDSAATTAHAVRATLTQERLLQVETTRSAAGDAPPRANDAPSPRTNVRFLATDSVDRFVRIGSRFLAREIKPGEVELVDL
jgi:glutamate racemase